MFIAYTIFGNKKNVRFIETNSPDSKSLKQDETFNLFWFSTLLDFTDKC